MKNVCRYIPGRVVQEFAPDTGKCLSQRFEPAKQPAPLVFRGVECEQFPVELVQPLSPVTQRRLRDGATAKALPFPQTLQEARQQLEILADGVRALQSLDDLGSPEANAAAWQAC